MSKEKENLVPLNVFVDRRVKAKIVSEAKKSGRSMSRQVRLLFDMALKIKGK